MVSILQTIFSNTFFKENVWSSSKIPKCPNNNIPTLIQIKAWCRLSAKLLPEPKTVGLPMHICVTRPRWDINSSPSSAIYMRQWMKSALVEIMGCRLFGAKPLSKPMLGYCPNWTPTNFMQTFIKIQKFYQQSIYVSYLCMLLVFIVVMADTLLATDVIKYAHRILAFSYLPISAFPKYMRLLSIFVKQTTFQKTATKVSTHMG